MTDNNDFREVDTDGTDLRTAGDADVTEDSVFCEEDSLKGTDVPAADSSAGADGQAAGSSEDVDTSAADTPGKVDVQAADTPDDVSVQAEQKGGTIKVTITRTGQNAKDEKKDKGGFDEFCSMCRRPESVCGKLIHVPNNMNICQDCMQKTFDTMGNIGGIPGFPGLDGVNLGELFGAPSGKGPNISFVNMSDLQGMFGGQQKVKQKKKKEKKQAEPVLDIRKIPAPHKIKASLDEYIVGQEYAKKVMSVGVYNHYKRVADLAKRRAQEENGKSSDQIPYIDDGVEIEKSNMLMVGPTGCGKTYLVKTLARLLDVPLAIADATSLTEAGYIGDDIESVLSKLLAAADNDVERAEHGIVFVDEIDKLAKKKSATQRDVSGESVQQGMLKLLEGAEIEVPVGATNKNAMVPMTTIDTSNILFICGGAFPGLEDIIKERLNEHASIGFRADLKDKYDGDENILRQVTTEDVRKFGMIPEFIGRLPILFALDALSEDMLVEILKEPKNAIIKQYQKLLSMDEVQLEFEDDALRSIAKKAKERGVGARALRSIIEEFMLDIMFEIPKDDNIGKVIITKAYIEKTGGPIIIPRGYATLETYEA